MKEESEPENQSGNAKLAVRVVNRQRTVRIEKSALVEAVVKVLASAGINGGEVSVVIVDDKAIAELNKQFLDHTGPTDVLSFPIDVSEQWLEADIVISAETAERNSKQYATSPEYEIMLYLVHGLLHLLGYDDHDPKQRQRMRRAERKWLTRLGLIANKSKAGRSRRAQK